jgi:predicted RNA-binding Zn ribbon-like protein
MFEIRLHDTAASAPGDLELVQRFMNLHEHLPGQESDLPPSREMVERFLKERGVLGQDEAFTDADRDTAIALSEALHAKVRTNHGEPIADSEIAVIDSLAQRAGLHPHFGREGPHLVPSEGGVDGALGRLVAIAFLADLDGSWGHLKECAGEGCRSVFYDRSKNHSGRWCSMSNCGNRAKVRAWRERQRIDERA